MSAANPTKIFGIRVGVDPKILVGGLVALAALLFWCNSRSNDETNAPASGSTRSTAVAPPTAVPSTPVQSSGGRAKTSAAARRGNSVANDRGRLRMRPIDPTRGDIDPTLRLDLLSRLSAVKFESAQRSVFEIGAPAPSPQQAETMAALKKNPPVIPPGPLKPPTYPTISNGPPPINIPLKYYGFAKPTEPGQVNHGFFLDTQDHDNVLVAGEGQVLKSRYLVVELTANTAKMEDTQLKQGQSLPVMPAAAQQP